MHIPSGKVKSIITGYNSVLIIAQLRLAFYPVCLCLFFGMLQHLVMIKREPQTHKKKSSKIQIEKETEGGMSSCHKVNGKIEVK